MGGSGKWMKVLIGHRKSDKEDNVSKILDFFFVPICSFFSSFGSKAWKW